MSVKLQKYTKNGNGLRNNIVSLGFCLYEDLQEDEIPPGYEITYFTNYKYNEEVEITMELPVLENNTMIAADYRTQEEIIKTINESNELLKKMKEIEEE